MAYSENQVIKALQKTHGMIYLAAEELGCSHVTIYSHIKKNPTVKAALEHINEKMLDVSELKLFDSIMNRESWAVKYYLSTKGRHRGYGAETPPTNVSVTVGVTESPTQRLAEKLEAMNERRLAVSANGHGVLTEDDDTL